MSLPASFVGGVPSGPSLTPILVVSLLLLVVFGVASKRYIAKKSSPRQQSRPDDPK